MSSSDLYSASELGVGSNQMTTSANEYTMAVDQKEDTHTTSTPATPTTPEGSRMPTKRKRSSAEDEDGARNVISHNTQGTSQLSAITNTNASHNTKRARVDALSRLVREIEKRDVSRDLYGFNPYIWQRIFSFVPPVFLGRCLRLSRSFNSMLTAFGSSDTLMPYSEDGKSSMSAATIWALSRKRFAPGLPKPLIGQTELDMWNLLRGDNCQLCGVRKRLAAFSDTGDAWNSGPGEDSVRVIWPFAVRCCGACLRAHTEQVNIPLFFFLCNPILT